MSLHFAAHRALLLLPALALVAGMATSDASAAPCPDLDSDGFAVCSGGCVPDPGDLCGDCNDAQAAINPNATETCDSIDDDCDTFLDDTPSMTCGQGSCTRFRPSCVNGVPQECPTLGSGVTEICDNGIDDDCDGNIDAGQPCPIGIGACLGSGVWTCAGTVHPACVGVPGQPSDELCDNIDNDCDGAVDEDLERPCSSACGTGVQVCLRGQWKECSAPACCNCVLDSTTTPDLCAKAGDPACPSICLLPGDYALSSACVFSSQSIRSADLNSPATVTGDLLTSGGRVQGLHLIGSARTNPWSTRYFGNIIDGFLLADGGDENSPAMWNVVHGDLTAREGYSVYGNTVIGGSLIGGGRGLNQVARNSVVGDGTSTCISMSRGAYIVQNSVENCGIGILKNDSSCCASGIIAQNEIRDAQIGIQSTLQEDGLLTIVGNRISEITQRGISIPWVGLDGMAVIADNLIDGSGGVLLEAEVGDGVVFEIDDDFLTPTRPWVLRSNTIVRNRVGVLARWLNKFGGTVEAVGNVIAENFSAAIEAEGGGGVCVQKNNAFANAGGFVGLPDPSGVDDNIDTSPGFVDSFGGDFHLTAGSPCVDRGEAWGISIDADGRTRELDGDLDGVPRADMGAFEVAPDVRAIDFDADLNHALWAPNPYALAGFDIYVADLDAAHATSLLSLHPEACGVPSSGYPMATLGPGISNALFIVVPRGLVSGSLGVDSAGQARIPVDTCP